LADNKSGLYLCEGCGIGTAVDIAALESVARSEFKVQRCVRHAVLCSDDGVASMRRDLDDGTSDRLVVAACSPRMMSERFAFDGIAVTRANLREHVAWTQPAGAEDTQMLAADQVRMALAQLSKTALPKPEAVAEADRTLLVVGGGVSGLTAALEAARSGYPVLLVERSDGLGGWAAQWSMRVPHLPPYREPRPNDIDRLIGAVRAEKRIRVLTGAKVVKTSGAPGRFEVTIAHGGAESIERAGAIVVATGWRPYDPSRLGHLGYGAPDVVTGVELESMLRRGALTRPSNGAPARRVAFIQCAGSRSAEHLPYCSSVCCGVSIKQSLQIAAADPEASAYIVYEELRTPGTTEEFYREAQRNGVVFIKGRVNGVDGSTMTIRLDDDLLGAETPLAGLDLIVLATGMVPNSTDPDAPAIEPEKSAAQLGNDVNPVIPIRVAGYKADLQARAPAIPAASATTPPPGGPILNLQYRQGPHLPILADGFPDSHYICFPYETRRTGIIACGPVRRPMGIGESAEDATGAVLKAIQAIEGARAGAAVLPRAGDLSYPKIGHDICTKCRRCTVECPFGAIDEEADGRPVVNTSRCRRCGTCMGACPVRTITFDNYHPQMIAAMIQANEIPDEFSEKPRMLVLACENDAYPALDMAAFRRSPWSPYVRIVPVRCLGSVTLLWVSTALEKGYDGVMLMGCKSGDEYQCHFVKGSGLARERMAMIGETLKSMMLEPQRVAYEEVSIADSGRVPRVIDTFAELIGALEPNPMKGF
jgi:quinone-modifying oxidoreductase subunit QmoB